MSSIQTTLTEKQYLIGLAIRQFNLQYGRSVRVEDCSIRSIVTNYGQELGYEITTPDVGIPGDTSEYLRLRIYLSFSNSSGMTNFRLEVEENAYTEGLGDEVYVGLGKIPQALRDNKTYAFDWIDVEENLDLAFIDMEGVPFRWMDGSYMETMELTGND